MRTALGRALVCLQNYEGLCEKKKKRYIKYSQNYLLILLTSGVPRSIFVFLFKRSFSHKYDLTGQAKKLLPFIPLFFCEPCQATSRGISFLLV